MRTLLPRLLLLSLLTALLVTNFLGRLNQPLPEDYKIPLLENMSYVSGSFGFVKDSNEFWPSPKAAHWAAEIYNALESSTKTESGDKVIQVDSGLDSDLPVALVCERPKKEGQDHLGLCDLSTLTFEKTKDTEVGTFEVKLPPTLSKKIYEALSIPAGQNGVKKVGNLFCQKSKVILQKVADYKCHFLKMMGAKLPALTAFGAIDGEQEEELLGWTLVHTQVFMERLGYIPQ